MKVKLLIYWSSYIPTANNDYKLFSCVAGTVGPNCRTPRQQTNLERQLYCYLETLKEIQNTNTQKRKKLGTWNKKNVETLRENLEDTGIQEGEQRKTQTTYCIHSR